MMSSSSSSSGGGVERVGELAINLILSKVGPKDIAAVGCSGRKMREWASEDNLWAQICSHELHLTSPIHPNGHTSCPTFKATYQAWRESFAMYPWPLIRRVKRCWDKLKVWLSTNFPEALATLRKGASEDDLNKVETALKVKLPLPTRVLYRFCNGQKITNEHFNKDMRGSPLGIIGGYSFYDSVTNVYLLPLNRVIKESKFVADQLQSSTRTKYIVVGNSTTRCGKIFFFNCANGQVYVGTRTLRTEREMMPCVPKALINSGDGMLLWLEEHGRRLENGIIKILDEGRYKTISLFPEEAPLCSTAVTNGVKVRASAVFVPEFSDLLDESQKYFFSYSIRMSLLPEGCNVHGMSFDSCQLYWRHWIIRAGDTVIDGVDGEAVIGKYPLLRPGQKEFVYASCSPQSTSSGSIEGSFTFVPGSLADPKADPFEVQVARFPLQLPDYIF